MESIKIFENEEFGQVRTVVIDGEIWFVGKDIAKALKYSNSRKALADHVDEEDKKALKIKTHGGIQSITIINEEGFYSLVQFSKTKNKKYKNNFKNWIVSLGLIEDKLVVESRKEIEFLDLLEETLAPFNISGERQYKVDNYKIDYYIPSLKVAIEYDENGHKDYSCDKQEGRQAYIEDKLGCRFIRVTDKYDNGYNVGLVLKSIFKL